MAHNAFSILQDLNEEDATLDIASLSKDQSEQYVLYQTISKAVKNNQRELTAHDELNIIKKIVEGKSKLQDYVKLKRLNEIFASFVEQSELDKVMQTHFSKPSKGRVWNSSGRYYFEFNDLTWLGTVTLCEYLFTKKLFKGVDIKLVNDGFIYTHIYTEAKNKYKHERHQLKNWFEVMNPEHVAELQGMLTFISKFFVSQNLNPLILFNCEHDRLDLQVKREFEDDNRSISITFEYGSPVHDFDDHWAE